MEGEEEWDKNSEDAHINEEEEENLEDFINELNLTF